MADLQLCYFCGRGPDDAIGEYAVVPPGLDPSPEQQQSVALCPDCRDKLMAVMEPVVDAAESFATGADSSGEHASGWTAAEGEVGRPRGEETPSNAESSGDAQGSGGGDGDEDTAGASGSASPSGSGDERGVGSDTAASSEDTGRSITSGDGDGDDATPRQPSSGPSDGSDDDEPVEPEDIMARNEGGVGGEESPEDSAAPRDQPHADDELVGRNNEAYNKTLRLLQNREFPVERHEIEQVAANAYQLDPQEVSDAIDALINKGLLLQEGAQLVRP